MYNDLFWVSTAIRYRAFPLAGIGRVIKVIHIAYRLSRRRKSEIMTIRDKLIINVFIDYLPY